MSQAVQGNRQPELFPRSKRPTIVIEENHRLVRIAERVDWTELEARAEVIRASKLKNAAGRPPHLRATLGAMLLMATRRMTYRDAEDQIRHYAPARYLCGLTETDWTPDFTTIQDFTELMGEEGLRLINQYVVEVAVEEKLADPRVMVADTTAQEAAIPWPNEMGLMASFLTSIGAASQKAGSALQEFVKKAAKKFKAGKERIRKYRLFAKTKEAKNKAVAQMACLIESIQGQLGQALEAQKTRLANYAKVAQAKVIRIHETMKRLMPQIRYWLKTGHVAVGKIISLHIPQLYSIVRGKVGKTVEFGLTWGISRLRGGFLRATLAQNRKELVDSQFAVQAVDEHIAMFGKAPRAYAYDRAGYSAENVAALKAKGIHQ